MSRTICNYLLVIFVCMFIAGQAAFATDKKVKLVSEKEAMTLLKEHATLDYHYIRLYRIQTSTVYGDGPKVSDAQFNSTTRACEALKKDGFATCDSGRGTVWGGEKMRWQKVTLTQKGLRKPYLPADGYSPDKGRCYPAGVRSNYKIVKIEHYETKGYKDLPTGQYVHFTYDYAPNNFGVSFGSSASTNKGIAKISHNIFTDTYKFEGLRIGPVSDTDTWWDTSWVDQREVFYGIKGYDPS